MEVEEGIGTGSFTSRIDDPEYRFQVFSDWKETKEAGSTITPEIFSNNKGIKVNELEDIVREFESFDENSLDESEIDE